MQRNPTLQPPAGAQKSNFQRKPTFPPPPIEMDSSSVRSRIPKRRSPPAIPFDQPLYQRRQATTTHHHIGPRNRGIDPRLVSPSSSYRRQQQSTPPLRPVDTRRQDASHRTTADEPHRSQRGGAQERREDPRDDRRRRSPQRSRSPRFDCQQRFRSVSQGFQDQLREFFADMFASRSQRYFPLSVDATEEQPTVFRL